jgi:predicted nucleic acid-binding protein
MKTIIDANVLVALFKKNTGDDDRVRIDGMLTDARIARSRIIIPSPALSEFAAKAHQDEMDFILGNRIFLVSSFDAKAAIVCGDMLRTWAAGLLDDKKDRHKAKFDMQILAIAKSVGASRLVTSDNGLRSKAVRENILSIGIRELPIPDSAKQHNMQFDPV